MTDLLSKPCTAFAGTRWLAAGALIDVALAINAAQASDPALSLLAFDDRTGAIIDLDLRGSTAEIVERLAERAKREALAVAEDKPRGRGRPKLGVVAREVTLLPRHWDWLAAQPGGASQALRRLVEAARRSDSGETQAKAAREAAYRFLTALAGNLPGFEEAIRCLFAGDEAGFADRMAAWPPDVRQHALKLSAGLPEIP